MINEKGFKYLTIILAVIYSMSFILFFTFNTSSVNNTDSFDKFNKDTKKVSNTEKSSEFSWLQLGIFKESSSMDVLVEKLKTLGIESVNVQHNDLQYLIVGLSNQSNETYDVSKICDDNNIEYMQKTSNVTDSNFLELYENKEYTKFMEVVISG